METIGRDAGAGISGGETDSTSGTGDSESHHEEGMDPFRLRQITHTLSNDDQCIFQHIIHIMHIMHILHMLHIWHA